MNKRIAVFQHLVVEHPGIFRDFLSEDNIHWQAFELDDGIALPQLEDFDALWVMGGPMDVWEDSKYPWLIDEKRAIRRAVTELDMPFLGVCLGHQLFAEALGGEVGPSEQAEVGIAGIRLTKEGNTHPIFSQLPQHLDCLQWHSAEVKHVPNDFTVLAESPACAIQALSLGAHQASIQFHIEVTNDTVSEWGAVPAYAEALEKTLGPGALVSFEQQTRSHLSDFNANARRFYQNWKAAAGF